MLDKLKSKLMPKQKQFRTSCMCGCGSTSSSTIAAHRKQITRRTNLDSLDAARSVSGLTRFSTSHLASSKHLSRQKPREPTQPAEDRTPEDPMEVDHPLASDSSSSPLTHVWAGRAGQHQREDEDLVSEPESPELSGDEDEVKNDGNQDADEPEFLTDDEEPPTHVEIPARNRLTADFQLHATRAGMLLVSC